MVIYFDYNIKKLLFIKQQNKQQYFAVDFLFENDFNSIEKQLEKVFKDNHSLLSSLKHGKNKLILPDQFIGFDILTVPSVKFGKNQYFYTKFNSLYNQKENLNVYPTALLKTKDQTVFNFCFIKKDIVENFILVFRKFGVNINFISYYSQALVDYLTIANKQIQKSLSVVVLNTKNSVKLVAVSSGNILGMEQFEIKEDNSIAKKFANSLRVKRKFETGKDQTSVVKNNTDFNSMLNMYLVDFIKSFNQPEIVFNFENAYLIDIDDEEYFKTVFKKCYNVEIPSWEDVLVKSESNVLFVPKRSFLKWKTQKD